MTSIQAASDLPILPLTSNTSSRVEASSNNTALLKFDIPGHLLAGINQLEHTLDTKLPKNKFQQVYDSYCEELANAMTTSPEEQQFTTWLQEKGHGKWYERLAQFLIRLPFKVARNLLTMITNVLKLAIITPSYIVMHPMKFMLQIMKILVSLMQPENMTKLGAGLMGSSAATAAVTNGFSAITFIIGAALAFTGVSIGSLKTALLADKNFKKEAVQNYLLEQGMDFTEAFVTSFTLVMTLEAFQQIVRGFQKLGNRLKNNSIQGGAKNNHYYKEVDNFIKTHDLPPGYRIEYPMTGHDRFFIKVDQSYFHKAPKIEGAWYHDLRSEFSHYKYYWRDVWRYVPEDNAWMYVPEQVSEAVYKNVHMYGVNVNMQNFVAPAKIPLGAAHRVSNATMNIAGASEAVITASTPNVAMPVPDVNSLVDPLLSITVPHSSRHLIKQRFQKKTEGTKREAIKSEQ